MPMSTRRIWTIRILFLCMLLPLPSNADLIRGSSPSSTKSCASKQRNVKCGQDKGIFYRYNSSNWRTISDPGSELPLRAGIGDKISVTVCNYRNSEINNAETLSAPRLPTLVRGVGGRATVSVFIINSCNMMVSKALQLRTMGKGKVRASLVGNAVGGKIGAGAQIFVAIRNSGNIFMQVPSMALEIRRAELVSEPVISKYRRPNCIRDACLEVEITDSGNVIGRKGGKAGVGLTLGGTLLRAGISTLCTRGGTQIAHITRSGNMYEVEGVALQGSSLVVPPIVSGNMKKTRLSAFVTASANVEVRTDIVMARSWLSWGLVRLSKAKGVEISSVAQNLGNIQAHRHNRSASGAVSNVVSIDGNAKKVVISAAAKNVGNVDARGGILLKSSASCLSALVRISGCSVLTKVQGLLEATCNIWSGSNVLIKRSALVGNMVLASHVMQLLVKVKMMTTANTYVAGVLHTSNATLVGNLVEVRKTTKTTLALAIAGRSANAERTSANSTSHICSSTRLMRSAVLLNVVDEGAVVKCAIRLNMVANSIAKAKKPSRYFGNALDSGRGADRIQVEQVNVGKILSSNS